eukprot:COSAG01_NODE_1538_length_9984_cov_92.104097_8_plen_109_part_00
MVCCLAQFLSTKPIQILPAPGLIKQFLKDTCWGQLDFLIIDSPPGGCRKRAFEALCGLIAAITLRNIRRTYFFGPVFEESYHGRRCSDCDNTAGMRIYTSQPKKQMAD